MYTSTLSEPEITYTSSGRPKYRRLLLSPMEKILNSFSVIFNLAMWIILLIQLPKLQDQIPLHQRDDGIIDSYVSSMFLLIFPGFGAVVFIALYILTLYPHMLVLRRIRVTTDNAPGVYMLTRGYYRAIGLVTQILLLAASMIWLSEAFANKVPGLIVILLPTVGIVVGTIALTLMFNSLVQDEAKPLLNKHEIIED